MSVISAFPRRPLKIQPVRHWFSIAFLLLIGAGYCWMITTEILPDLLDDVQLKDGGTLARARIRSARCSVYGGVIIYSCKVEAEYLAAGGERMVKTFRSETLFTRIRSEQVPFTLRYDPKQPGHASTSWGVEMLTNRITTMVLFTIPAGLGMVAMGFFVIRKQITTSSAMASIEANPIPVAATIEGRGGRSHWRFSWPHPMTGQPLKASTELKKSGGALLDRRHAHQSFGAGRYGRSRGAGGWSVEIGKPHWRGAVGADGGAGFCESGSSAGRRC